MLLQLDPVRFIQIFVVQGFLSFLYFFMGSFILRRDTKRLNLTLSLFYMSIGVAGVLNMIYALIQIYIGTNEAVYLLHFITYYLYCTGLIFLLAFILILLKSESTITLKLEVGLIIVFLLLLLVMWFIPGGIEFNSYDGKPNWSWPFGIYALTICSIVIVPTLVYSLRLYFKFDNQELKKKWRYFIIGILAFFFLYYGTTLSNVLNDAAFRALWSIFSLFSLILISFIYLGVGKQLK